MTEENQQSKPSITAKLEPGRLKRAIKRRQKARRVTHLYDPSVPRSLLFLGVINRGRRKQGKLPISVGKHELSPFVVYLDQNLPEPSEMLAEESVPIRAPNLLMGDTHDVAVETVSQEELTADLAVGFEEVRSQLREDAVGISQNWARWMLPRMSNPITSLRRSKRQQAAFQHPETLHERFSPNTIAPPQPPASFDTYFDLPEEEDVDEAELVFWDDIAGKESTSPLPDNEPETTTPAHGRRQRTNWAFLHRLFQRRLPEGWPRAVGAFVVLSFVFVLPIYAMSAVSGLKDVRAHLNVSGQHALQQLSTGANAALVRDVEGASNAFRQANKAFDEAAQSIDDLGAGTELLLASLPGTKRYYQTADRLVKAGKEFSVAGEQLTDGFSALQKDIEPTLTSRLSLLSTYADTALEHLRTANTHFSQINTDLVPADHRGTLKTVRSQLPTVIESFEEFMEFNDMAQTVLGAERKKRYLVVFQNNTELRATGGFMGSFAEIDVKDGEIVGMRVPGGGTYDLQGSLNKNVIAPPPLQLLRARWEFQDANWFPDFPTSARQMLDFYEASGGPTVDGVIAVNATYVADMLALLGPIEMPEYGRTITSENFLLETQKIVEMEYDKEENRPKAFIGDLAPKLLERIKNQSATDFLSLVDFLNKGLTEQHIQLYFTDNKTQKRVHALGWDGRIKWTDGDYLMVVDTNLGGGKTDGVIEQDVELDVRISESGTITNTVTVKRKHYGIRNALFSGVNNVDYLRVYVPKGSELIHSDGFTPPDKTLFETPQDNWQMDDDLLYSASTREVDETTGTVSYDAFGKTVFGNWVQTQPGSTSTATFTYRLPFTVDVLRKKPGVVDKLKRAIGLPDTDRYTLTVQKQSGVLDRTTEVNIDAPPTLTPVWSSHELKNAQFKNHDDAFMAVLFESGTYDE